MVKTIVKIPEDIKLITNSEKNFTEISLREWYINSDEICTDWTIPNSLLRYMGAKPMKQGPKR